MPASPGAVRASPLQLRIHAEPEMPTPSSGPSVSTVQYTSMLCSSLRGRWTCQMALKDPVDGQHQRQRGKGQQGEADCRQPAGIVGELLEVDRNDASGKVRYQVAQQEFLELARQLFEYRKRRHHDQADG